MSELGDQILARWRDAGGTPADPRLALKIRAALQDGSIEGATREEIEQAFTHLAIEAFKLERRLYELELNYMVTSGLLGNRNNQLDEVRANRRAVVNNRNEGRWEAEHDRHRQVRAVQQARAGGNKPPLSAANMHRLRLVLNRTGDPGITDHEVWGVRAISKSITLLKCVEEIEPLTQPVSTGVSAHAYIVRERMREAGLECKWADRMIESAVRFIDSER